MTAVDFIFEHLKYYLPLLHKECCDIEQIEHEAKAIEKQQIVDAYWAGLNGPINDYSEAKEVGSTMIGIKFAGGAEQYYNSLITPDKL